MKACEFFIEGSDKPLSYDEMRLYLLNNPEFWKAKKSKDALQEFISVSVDAGQQARDGEKVEGGTPQAEPKKTAGKGKSKTKEKVTDGRTRIVESLESKADSADEVELNEVIAGADRLINEAVAQAEAAKELGGTLAKITAKEAKAKNKAITEAVQEAVRKAVAILHEKFPDSKKENGYIGIDDYEAAAQALRDAGLDAKAIDRVKTYVSGYKFRDDLDEYHQKGVLITVKVGNSVYDLNLSDPNEALKMVNAMPKSVEGGVRTKSAITPLRTLPAPYFDLGVIADYVANTANLEQAKKMLEQAKANKDKGAQEAAQKLIKLFDDAVSNAIRNFNSAIYDIELDQKEKDKYAAFIKEKLTFDAIDMVGKMPEYESKALDEAYKRAGEVRGTTPLLAETIVKNAIAELNDKFGAAFKSYMDNLMKAQEYLDMPIDKQIEADKQALRDYFKGFQNMGIISDPYQQAKADIAALKVLIRLIKNGTIRTLSDLEQYLKERNKGMNDAMRRIYKAAQHFMDDDNENPTEDMLAEYYDASNPKPEPQPKPEPESDDDDFDATRFGPTGKKKERGFIKNLPQGVKDSITKIEDKHGRDILLYDTYPDEKLIADAKAIWAELNNPDAVAVLISRDNSVHPAVKMALSIMYASHLNQLAEQETDPSRKDKYIEQRDEVLAYIGTRGTDFGQATSFLRFLELMPASTASASMRQIAHSIVMKRWEKARNRIVDVVAEYDTAVKNARREAVTSKPVEAAMEVAFNQMQGNSRRASEGNEKAIAKTRAEAIAKVRNKAIEKLEKLKADISGKMYSGGVFLLVWNAGIDAAIVAVKGGASFAQAVNKAMEAANKAAINTLSPEEAKTFTDKQSDDFRAKIEEMLSDVKQAEIDEAKNIDNLTEKEKEAFVKRTLSDLRVQVRKVVQEHNPNNLIGKTLAEQLHSDIDGLTQEQANSIARAIDDYVNKKVEDAKKKAVEAIINKLAKARVDGTPLTKEEREAISAKLLDLIKKGYPVDKAVKNALGEVIGTELPADFDTKVTDYRKAIDDAKTEGERTQALQDMADYVANSTGGDTVMQYLEDVWFGSMLSGFSTSARNAFGLVYNTVTKQFPAFFYLLYNTKDFKLAAQGLVGFIQGVANNLEHAKDVIVSGKQYDRGFGVEPRRLIDRKSFKEVMDMMPVSGDVEAWKKVGNAVLRVATAGTYPVAKYMPRLLAATDVLFFGAGRESALYTDAVIAAYQAVKERKGGGKVTSKEVMQYAQENYLFNDQPNMARFLAEAQKDLAAQGKTVGKVKMKQLQREYMQAFRERMGDAGMLADASRQGAMLTYNYVPEGTLGLLSRWLNRWRAKIPLLKYIIPFVNIPINVLNQQIDATPWGLVRGIMGETSVIGGLGKKANAGSPFAKYSKEMAGYERYEVLAKGMMGTALIMALMMFDNGEDEEQTMEITAGGTYDYNKNREIPGYMEYSVKINGTRISYKDWPIAPILAFYGGLMDYKRYGAKEGENVAMLVLSRLAKYINDGTWWGNMVGLVGLINPAVVTTKGRSIPQELTESTIRKVMTLTPVGSGLWQQGMRQFYEMVEEPKRGNLSRSKDYGGLEAGLKNSLMRVGTTIPVIRDKYGVVYNSLGMPITEKQAVLPFETMEEDTSVVGRLYKAFTEAGVSVGVPKVPEVGIVNYNTMESRPMNDTEYELYKKLSADYTREGLVPHVELIEAFGEVYKLRKKLDRIEDGIPVFKDEESRAKYAEMEKKLFDLDYEITPDMIKENYVGKVLKGVKADARKRAHFRVSMNRNPDAAEAAGFDSEDFAIDEIELLRKRR